MMREMSRISSWPNWSILAAITALAAVLRLWQIGESLWVDELHTSWCVQGSFSQVAKRAALGNQSPLYFYLVWGVTRLLGESEFSLRLPSLLAGIALPGMTWLLVRRLGLEAKTEAASLLAALLVSIDHTSIFFATEARPYALVELLGAVSLLLAIRAIRGDLLSRIALVAVQVTLFYLQYSTVLYIAAIFGCLLVSSIFGMGDHSLHWKAWIVDGGVTLLLCLPATLQIVEIASRRGAWTSFVNLYSTADVYVALVAMLVLWVRIPPAGVLMAAATCLIPVLLAWGLTYWSIAPLLHTRYIVATTPALWACFAASSQVSDHQRWRCLAAIVVAALALWWSGIVQNFLAERTPLIDRTENWRSAISAVQREHQQHSGWKILVHSGLIETDALRQPHDGKLREYGLLPVKALYPLHAEGNDLIPLPMSEPGKLTAETRNEVLRAGGAVIILRLSAVRAAAVEKDLAQSFAEKDAAATVINRQAFGDVQVITVQVR